MSRRLGSWILGLIVAVVLVGAVTPADAQVIVRVGPHHRRYHHHHRYYRHGRGYRR